MSAAGGRLDEALRRLLMKRATVVQSERLTDRFSLITIQGPALEGVAWTPGDKVQIAMGSAFVARTYTPIDWDAPAGRFRTLGYAHGDGPGSAWVRGVEPGQECDIFGPRASVDGRRMTGPLAVFGDETSIGLACALAGADRMRLVGACLEVRDAPGAERVLARLGFGAAALFGRSDDDGHLDEMEATLAPLAATGASFVLTGRAGAVQRLRQSLKQRGVPAGRIVAKAYWAPGKTGLD